MVGLLDFLNTPESQLGIGLLAAASSGQGFGEGLLGATQYAQQMRQAKAMEDWRQAQIARQKQEWEQADRAQQAAARKQAALPSLFGEGNRLDWQQALAAGYTPDEIQKLANAPNAGRAKVARTVQTTDAQGRPVTIQLDEFGQPVGEGMAEWKAPVSVNQGDRTTFVDPVTLQPQQSFGVNMSQAERDASARGWASNRIAQERLALERTKSAEGAKPIFNADAGGFVYPPSDKNPSGVVVPLPGFKKPLNDTQAKANLFGTRMQEADAIINELAAQGKEFSTPGANAGWGIGSAVNLLNTAKGQQLDQAKRDFLNAVLRRESGAAIAASEFDSGNKQYFPQMGDSSEVIEQKAKSRATAIQGILAEVPEYARAGPVAPPPGKSEPRKVFQMLPNASQYAGKRLRGSDGTIYRSTGGKWVKE